MKDVWRHAAMVSEFKDRPEWIFIDDVYLSADILQRGIFYGLLRVDAFHCGRLDRNSGQRVSAKCDFDGGGSGHGRFAVRAFYSISVI